MKLFQKLLLAPVAIGFIAPISANASETNLMDVSSYSQVDVEVTQDTFKPLSTKNPLLAGGEGLGSNLSSDFDEDSFSSTTTASFSSNFVLGAVDGIADETTKFAVDYGIDVSTSFNGSDSLDVALVAGNGGAQLADADLDTNSSLEVDSITYTNQLGDKLSMFVSLGGGSAGSTLYASTCLYGGITDAMDDCGVANTNLDEGFGSALGFRFDFTDSLSFSAAVEGQGMDKKGLLSREGADAVGAQIAYVTDNYGLSYAFASIENHDALNALDTNVSLRGLTTHSALSAFYNPDINNFPSISVGFESSHDDYKAADADEKNHYFVGLQWDEVGNGSLGASFGSKEPYLENADTEMMYEVFYSYNYADGITITPVMFVKEKAAANVSDETGFLLKGSFSF